MGKVEFLSEVVEHAILDHEDEAFPDMLQRIHFVMQLNENRFGRHFPIHPE
jgi:hypothetical protein